MNYSSSVFLYVFLPAFFGIFSLIHLLASKISFLRKYRVEDICILGFGLAFYLCVCFNNVFFLTLLILVVFVIGKYIVSGVSDKHQRLSAVIVVFTITLFALILFLNKYEWVLDLFRIRFIPILTPLGLSFLIFSAISFIVDVYKNRSDSFTLLDVALYITFFPKITSGPIVLWRDWKRNYDPNHGSVSADFAVAGIERIIVGMAKKVILADYFGRTIDRITAGNMDCITAWLVCVLYMLEIYYDFSGYSDIAIGISRFLGVTIKENFDYPYTAVSISDFWRRWHISLGTWLKEYVYIPLGGSRKDNLRTLLNLMVVMLVSGLWHGAVVWGLIHGLCIVVERLCRDKIWYKRIPVLVKWLFTMLVVMLGWQIFRTNSLTETLNHIKLMLNIGVSQDLTFTYRYWLSKKIVFFIAVAVFGAIGAGRIRDFLNRFKWYDSVVFQIAKPFLLICLWLITLVCKTNSSYSPFIYFKY